ncbi:tetratricopeptide repeat protein [Roseibacterium sp. SDUM158017]|uniref:tetratricopeptide repeat protein n=1 Tax=Roseicyclus salinarum TaxID=3036773 RepID=UPI002415220C|nr:tetratricopeptide repeat protein [Roseibacterium sp. SDUM158017]MDG4649604.1 tetratricopeptide repeat protein [Roseibacterium sp. SDUM158017]
MFRSTATRLILVCGVALLLAACQSGEERAEEHYQNALRLIEEGDFDRASVEFRNVFENNGQHREARARFAQMLRDTGDFQRSYSQYLRLAEQYPDDLPARIALAEMAIATQNWEEARRHGERAIELAPGDPALSVISMNLSYADAIEAEDEPTRRAVADDARALLDETPQNMLLRAIVIDSALRDGEFERVLSEIGIALAQSPDDRRLHNTRLAVLAQLERADELEQQLRDMIARFPNDSELPGTLLRFYVARGEQNAAREFLREFAATAEEPEQQRDAKTALVQLVLQQEGPEAALEQIDTILAGIEDPADAAAFRALRAGIRFDQGERDAGIAEMEATLAGELPVEVDGRLRVALARMLMATGNQVGARALVEEVLAADAGQIDALKMKAAWLIEEDQTREAITLLRTALDNSPDDVQALTLTAQAHARNGDRNLAREFLALAVEASNAAPDISIRYADLLASEERYLPAEEVLISALRLAPGNLQLLSSLGELYIAMEDWGRAEQVEETLRRQETAEATRIAAGLQASRLAAQGDMEDAVAFLEQLASQGGGQDLAAEIAVVRARLATGDTDGALTYLDSLLADNPEDFTLRFVQATVWSGIGRYAEAAAAYRALLEERPDVEQLWIGLIRTLYGQGDIEGAEAALEDGLAALPEGLNLLWAQASFRERQGDYEGAIALYEMMYERAPNQPVIANNLASLISTYRTDAENLERAYTIARRLRGSDFAPFQDTYGWIAYRQGDYQEALDHLEPAAAALAEDPLVQFHLGMTYAALERNGEALEQLRRAVELAGPEDAREQFDTARAEIDRLEATLQAEPEADDESGQ